MTSEVNIADRSLNATAEKGTHLILFTLLGILVWVLGWYWPTAVQMYDIWQNSVTFAHGIVVLPISAWLVWRLRHRLAEMTPEPMAIMIIPIAIIGAGWMLARMINVNVVGHFALITLFIMAVIGVLGWRIARTLSFPLGFLYFAAPFGDFMLPALMHYTAEFTVGALRLSGVPVYQEGLYFVIPNGRWSVVEACSGIRYLIASLMVGTLYAYLNYRSTTRRLLFVGVAIIVPIVANWVRAYLIVMLGYLSNNKIAAGVDHLIYGWLFFGVIIMLMFWIGSRWQEFDGDDKSLAQAEGPSMGGSAGQALRQRWHVAIWPLMILTAFPVLLGRVDAPVQPFQVELAAPQPATGWTIDSDATPSYAPGYTGHRAELIRSYRSPDGQPVVLYVAYYADQREGSELVSWHNDLIGRSDGGSWSLLRVGGDRLAIGPVHTALLRDPGPGRVAVWHWYWSDDRFVTSDIRSKITLALAHLTGRNDDAAFIAVYAPFEDNAGEARPTVAAFVEAHADAILEQLRAVKTMRQGYP